MYIVNVAKTEGWMSTLELQWVQKTVSRNPIAIKIYVLHLNLSFIFHVSRRAVFRTNFHSQLVRQSRRFMILGMLFIDAHGLACRCRSLYIYITRITMPASSKYAFSAIKIHWRALYQSAYSIDIFSLFLCHSSLYLFAIKNLNVYIKLIVTIEMERKCEIESTLHEKNKIKSQAHILPLPCIMYSFSSFHFLFSI